MIELPISRLIQFLPLALAGTGVIKNPGMATLAGMLGGSLPHLFPGMGMGGIPQRPVPQPYFGGLSAVRSPAAHGFGLSPDALALLGMRFPMM